MYHCKWNQASSETNVNCGLTSSLMTDCRNQLWKWTLLAGSRSCKTCVYYCCFIGSKLQRLGRPSCTRLRHSSFFRHSGGFLCVCSRLAPMSSNFSSVSTQHLCFCFLTVKSPIDLSVFIKLWIVCLLGTLASWNLRQNFRQNFLADPYLMQVSYRNTRCPEVYRTMMEHTAENKQLTDLITAGHCWQIINKLQHMYGTTH
jgi:hypothetical protein